MFHKLASPRHFYDLSGRTLPWLGWITVVLLLTGLYWGLVVAPPDYQQGESYRIIFIHVPSAWMSLFVYVVMATAAGIGLVWKMKLAEVIAGDCAPLGASFTALALVTGMLWGKPMWGAYWVWDARLTSELILLFLYLGVIALRNAIEDPRTAARASGVWRWWAWSTFPSFIIRWCGGTRCIRARPSPSSTHQAYTSACWYHC
jgi:heme exporter protein C